MLEEGLAASVNEALEQDLDMCEAILSMRQYERLTEMERRDPKKLSAMQYQWLGQMEKQAGVSVADERELELLAKKLSR